MPPQARAPPAAPPLKPEALHHPPLVAADPAPGVLQAAGLAPQSLQVPVPAIHRLQLQLAAAAIQA